MAEMADSSPTGNAAASTDHIGAAFVGFSSLAAIAALLWFLDGAHLQKRLRHRILNS